MLGLPYRLKRRHVLCACPRPRRLGHVIRWILVVHCHYVGQRPALSPPPPSPVSEILLASRSGFPSGTTFSYTHTFLPFNISIVSISIQIDHHTEGSLMAEKYCRTGEKRTNKNRRMSHYATFHRLQLTDVMCYRPGDTNRRTPRRPPRNIWFLHECVSIVCRQIQSDDRRMATVCSCVLKMEKRCSSITTSPEPATCLYTQNTRKGHTGCLASLALHRRGPYGIIIRHGQC